MLGMLALVVGGLYVRDAYFGEFIPILLQSVI